MGTRSSASCICFPRFADAARHLADTEHKPAPAPESPIAAAVLAWLALALHLRGDVSQGGQLGVLPQTAHGLGTGLLEAAKARALEQDGHEASLLGTLNNLPIFTLVR